MFERILVPLDGSARAEMILPQLGRILRHEKAELILLRSIHTPPVPVEWAATVTELRRRERADSQAYLDDVCRRFSGRGAKVSARIVTGPPEDSILKVARQAKATAIAMATHGRSGLARFAFGSVAEKVLRASDVPVLLVRSFRGDSRGELHPMTDEELPFRKILVPVDGGKTAAAALRPAIAVARLFESEAVVLRVVPPYIPPGPILPGMEPIIPPEIPQPDSEKDPATAAAAKRFAAAGVKAERRTVIGDPAAAILDHAYEKGVDLIAMATHGRSGLKRWALGSVTERVLRAATVPMLVVRSR